MSLQWGAILPHGSQTIPAVAGTGGASFAATRQGMETVARAVAPKPADVVIVATPHGIRAEGGVTVSFSEYAAGVLTEGSERLEARYRVHQGLARQIHDAARRRHLDAPLLSYGASSGPASRLPMDWGVQVPLWFVAPPGPDAPAIVILCPSRSLSFEALAQFGEAVADAALAFPGRVAFIASADQCHAHQADGPYGFHSAAAQLDAEIVRHVREDRLEDLFGLDPVLIANGKPDALWQMAMLAGVRRRVTWSAHFVAYDVPTYFGMLSAYYLP